jgi:hypothetical protein
MVVLGKRIYPRFADIPQPTWLPLTSCAKFWRPRPTDSTLEAT